MTGARRRARKLPEAGGGERRLERLFAEARREVGVELAGLEEQPGAEAAHVTVGDVGAVVEADERTPVRVVVEPGVAVAEAPGHPQVDQQDAVGLEADDQVLAAPLDRGDALSLELGGDLVGVVGPHEPGVADLDALEAPAGEHRLEPPADRLDLGQLGHRASVDSPACPAEPRLGAWHLDVSCGATSCTWCGTCTAGPRLAPGA